MRFEAVVDQNSVEFAMRLYGPAVFASMLRGRLQINLIEFNRRSNHYHVSHSKRREPDKD
jgi:hypothetical protein